jgi:hypothetical protein
LQSDNIAPFPRSRREKDQAQWQANPSPLTEQAMATTTAIGIFSVSTYLISTFTRSMGMTGLPSRQKDLLGSSVRQLSLSVRPSLLEYGFS